MVTMTTDPRPTPPTPYERAMDYARAYEDEAWARASSSAWARLEAIATEHQRGEYDWPRAQALLDETVRDMRAADAPPATDPTPTFAESLRARLSEYDDTLATPGQAQDIAELDLLDDVRALVAATSFAWARRHPVDSTETVVTSSSQESGRPRRGATGPLPPCPECRARLTLGWTDGRPTILCTRCDWSEWLDQSGLADPPDRD